MVMIHRITMLLIHNIRLFMLHKIGVLAICFFHKKHKTKAPPLSGRLIVY